MPGQRKPKKARSTAKSWKGGVGRTEEVDLPSGNVALIKRCGIQAFLTGGVIPDPLSPIIQKAIAEEEGLPPSKIKAMFEDPQMLDTMFEMMDRVVCYAVQDPKVNMPPACLFQVSAVGDVCGKYHGDPSGVHTDQKNKQFHEYEEADRDPDLLYADNVDLDDKIFVFNFAVGGTRDLERFRREQAASLASISGGQGVENTA